LEALDAVGVQGRGDLLGDIEDGLIRREHEFLLG